MYNILLPMELFLRIISSVNYAFSVKWAFCLTQLLEILQRQAKRKMLRSCGLEYLSTELSGSFKLHTVRSCRRFPNLDCFLPDMDCDVYQTRIIQVVIGVFVLEQRVFVMWREVDRWSFFFFFPRKEAKFTFSIACMDYITV